MSEQLVGKYHGDRKPLFWLSVRVGFLTLITLGIYRFWGKTRIRKYIWSATSAGEDSFEYTGTGLEKFLGFLVAIVILAIYLGIVQMVLLFFGLSLIGDATTVAEEIAQLAALYLTIFAVLPLYLFARYRARRYKAARTRWRGVRFGMESAAWGFVWRAIGHYLLTIITLGLLLPRQTFYLEKYMVDRTWYGDAKFVQDGRWQSLYFGLKHIAIGLGITVILGAGFAYLGAPVMSVISIIVGYIWWLCGVAYYRIYALNYLAGTKSLDGKIGFFSQASTRRVLKVYFVGSLVITGAILLISIVYGILIGPFVFSFPPSLEDITGVGGSVAAVAGAFAYVAALLAFGALSLVWITQPIIGHVVSNIALSGAEHFDAIQQRNADEGADAEGFADALDLGGAI